ncbi:OpgC domain-containing protein [Rhodoferax koreense]|uniref:OpgC domain-containing protein n=1 Tax=Rhodoferax koreensis TaxID=1842727 RepID=UPI001EF71627|nr:OpgC domain-containing protein [Rhodoferax koreense]
MPRSSGSTRRWEIDALRGLMLVLMTFTHLPTRLSSPMGQPFGYVSAAEGFVLLSAYVTGMVYSRLAQKQGIAAMRKAFLRRAAKVYFCQAASLLVLFTVIAAVGMKVDHAPVREIISFYLREPITALLSGLALVYEPPLLDILPMYVVFMLVSPLVLGFALRSGWGRVIGASLLLWVLAQFDFGRWLHGQMVVFTGLPVSYVQTGPFVTFAWQFLWVLGLWMGSHTSDKAAGTWLFPGWAVVVAAVYAAACLVWRHWFGQIPFAPGFWANDAFDKWHLAPFRLINLFALMVLAMHFADWLRRHAPRSRILETMGSASLTVFCTHLLMVFLVLAWWGDSAQARPVWGDIALLAAVFAGLYGVAAIVAWLENSPARWVPAHERHPDSGDTAPELPPPLEGALLTERLQLAPGVAQPTRQRRWLRS